MVCRLVGTRGNLSSGALGRRGGSVALLPPLDEEAAIMVDHDLGFDLKTYPQAQESLVSRDPRP